jgi:hypothetical protein
MLLAPSLSLLDALATAVGSRDLPQVRRLINGPGSAALPREVREEALAIAGAPHESWRAPVALWRCYHWTTQLLLSVPLIEPAEPWSDSEPTDPRQLELDPTW